MPPPLACPPVGLCLSKGGPGSAEGGEGGAGFGGKRSKLAFSCFLSLAALLSFLCQMSVSVSSQVSMATFRVIRLGIGGGWLLGK